MSDRYKIIEIIFNFFGLPKSCFGINDQITNIKTQNMKKVFSIIAVALVATMVACGPSAEEKAKAEEAAKATADSIAKALEASLNTAVEAAATTDSAAAATTEAAPAAEPAKEEAHH